MRLFYCVVSGLLAAPLAAAAAEFIDLPAEQTGVNFGHSFDEGNPRAFLYHSGFACGGYALLTSVGINFLISTSLMVRGKMHSTSTKEGCASRCLLRRR